MTRSSDWRAFAACQGEDPELFFPLGGDGRWAAQIQQAKAICGRCPVRQACLDDALKEEGGRHYRYGIRGGLSETQRRREYEKRRKAVKASTA